MERYMSALLREAEQRKAYLTEPIDTVYIGGGTPSLLPPDLISHLLSGLRDIFSFSSACEFSVEANPGTLSYAWLRTVSRFGADRISIGMQAFRDDQLSVLGRIHRFEDVVRSVHKARAAGFRNISLDLIFGIPGQTLETWRETLDAALSLNPDHISAYGLIPEEGTPLYRSLLSGELSLPDPDLEREMYDLAISLLSDAGLAQYEISNFARPGFECRHNIGYWDQVPYLGLGLSSASMVRGNASDTDCFSTRWTNPSALDDYMDLIDYPDRLHSLQEIISPNEARFETVMLSLRMTKGIRRERFRELHGGYPEQYYNNTLLELRDRGLIVLEEDSWRLTRRGMDIQNSVLLEFMKD